MITYIQLNDKGILDVKDEVSVPLNFSIAEIQDISKRQGGFSKTIKLPGTSNNNNLLGHLFDVNIADASFNINIKQRCQIIQNGVSVFDGYLQLLNVNKLSQSTGIPDETVEYEVSVKDDSGNFYSSLQEKMLEDLPYWSQYNHIYTLSSITATQSNTAANGYTYILPFKANTYYNITDFSPAIYAKAYWDRIFLQAGYTYEWDSLEACGFDKLIVPYNGDTPLNLSNKYYARAGFSGATVQIPFTGASNTTVTSGSTMIFDNEVTLPNYDGNNLYNPLTGQYTSNFNGSIIAKAKYYYSIEMSVANDTQFKNISGNTKLEFNLSQIFNKNSVNPVSVLFSNELVFSGGTGEVYFIPVGNYLIFSGITNEVSAIYDVLVGDTIGTKLNIDFLNSGDWYDAGGVSIIPPSQRPVFTIKYRLVNEDYQNNYLKFEPTGNLNEGQLVEMDNFIPKQIKQKDFINGIVKLFNLYLTPDKYEENHIIIQTRDDYYDSGPIVDWTDKFVLDSDATIEFLPDLQDKRLILSYKQDNDEWNKQYQLATGEIYGQVQYEFENEFTQSTKKIETIFSPTPIIPNTNGLLVPAILSKNPKTNIRILYYDGWKGGNWFYQINSGSTAGSTVSFRTYPRALHLDNPINPTIDINFAQPDYFGYSSYETVTDNNLYNRFWSRFINQIETGKLLKATFLLDENDIHNLDLRSKVWLHDCYWNINRIIDYNPNGNGLTKVELISVDTGLQFAPSNIDRNSTGNTVTDVGIKNNWITNLVSINDSQSKNLFGTTVVNTPVFGQDNVIQSRSQSTLVLGDGNKVSASDSIVIGENNNVEGNNMFAFGNNITVTGDSQAVFNVPLSATVISATTLYVDGSPTPIEPSVWVEGSAGNFSIKAINDSTTDATGNYAVAEGFNTLASGEAAHAEGGATIASGLGAHAEGNQTTASGDNSHAEGFVTTASGTDSHAEGSSSVASGSASHAEGLGTEASGNFGSHAEGNLTTASGGNGAHAEGSSTTAAGESSHAQGSGSEAQGRNSFAGGKLANAKLDGEFAFNSIENSTVLGDSQWGIINANLITNNATPTNIEFTLNGSTVAAGFQTTNNLCVIGFRYIITVNNAAVTASRIITGEGLVRVDGAGVHTLAYASTPSVNGDLGLLGVTATPVISGGGLKFQVTGLAQQLFWGVRMDYLINI